jgi:hypothetical protein
MLCAKKRLWGFSKGGRAHLKVFPLFSPPHGLPHFVLVPGTALAAIHPARGPTEFPAIWPGEAGGSKGREGKDGRSCNVVRGLVRSIGNSVRAGKVGRIGRSIP